MPKIAHTYRRPCHCLPARWLSTSITIKRHICSRIFGDTLMRMFPLARSKLCRANIKWKLPFTHTYTHMHVECIVISEHKWHRLELIKTWERDATIFRSWQILCSRCFPLIRNKWKLLWIILRAILIRYTLTARNNVIPQLAQRMENSNNSFGEFSISIKWMQSIQVNLFP